MCRCRSTDRTLGLPFVLFRAIFRQSPHLKRLHGVSASLILSAEWRMHFRHRVAVTREREEVEAPLSGV